MVDGGLAAVLENCVRKEVQRASMLPMVTTMRERKFLTGMRTKTTISDDFFTNLITQSVQKARMGICMCTAYQYIFFWLGINKN